MAETVNFDKLLNANYVGVAYEEVQNANPDDYLGERLFGYRKQTALTLDWIKGFNGAPIAISPAAYDAEVVLRTKGKLQKVTTEMPLFREGYQVTESDRRNMQDAVALGDDRLNEALSKYYIGVTDLVKGAKVNPEIMRWQLLAPTDGKPKIIMSHNNVNYSYDYDQSGEWYANNFIDVSTSPWSNAATATPIEDTQKVVEAAKDKGVNLEYGVVSQKTMLEIMNSAEVKSAALSQNLTPNVYMTPTIAKNIFKELTGVSLIVYNMIYRDFEEKTKKFMPDGLITLLPEGEVGNTVYAVTPEEFDLQSDPKKNVAVVEGGIAISVVPTTDMPRRFATYVSEIVLPSYERMSEVFVIKVDENK